MRTSVETLTILQTAYKKIYDFYDGMVKNFLFYTSSKRINAQIDAINSFKLLAKEDLANNGSSIELYNRIEVTYGEMIKFVANSTNPHTRAMLQVIADELQALLEQYATL
jgi:hypothetical protein